MPLQVCGISNRNCTEILPKAGRILLPTGLTSGLIYWLTPKQSLWQVSSFPKTMCFIMIVPPHLPGKPHTLFATIFRRGPDPVGHAKTHPGPSHANQQLRRLGGCCWPTLLQPLVVKGVFDNPVKGQWERRCQAAATGRDEGLGSPSLWAENRKNFAFARDLPFPSHSLQIPCL